MKHFFLFALLTAPTAFLTAQSEQTIIDRAQQPAPPPQPVEQAPVTVSPGDADAGNQRVAEQRKLPFKLFVAYDAQVYYTDNVRLVSDEATEDYALVIANTVALRAEFKSIAVGDALLTPSAGFTFQRFYHGVGSNDHDDLDFDAYSVPLSLRYRFGNNWEAGLGLNNTVIYSLDGPPKYNRIFRSHSPTLTLRKLISLGEKHLLSIGGGLSYSITKADDDSVPAGFTAFRDDRNDKWDYSLDAAYYYLTGKWVVSPYARLSYSDYLHYEETNLAPFAATEVDRRDFTGSLGLSVSYNFTSWAAARAFTSFDWRESVGDDAFDYGYENTNVGVGLTLNVTF